MDISYKGQYVEEKNWDLKALGKLGGECLLALGQKAVEKVLDESNLGTLLNASTVVLDKSKAFYELTDKLQSAAGYEKIQGDENALTYYPFHDSIPRQILLILVFVTVISLSCTAAISGKKANIPNIMKLEKHIT